ncbi:hypothetical protein V1460_25920 [Streptomyces sp. SCSIO 30461]|uniref:hypothetical protein n=1 Tax=Streptomyces sp. SCSIO 30461 TaxID=3118085 RepID=UPI0030CDF57A
MPSTRPSDGCSPPSCPTSTTTAPFCSSSARLAARTPRAPAARLRPATGGTPGARRLLRGTPLYRDHSLVLADIGALSGAVSPGVRLLFPAGARLYPGETAVVSLRP